MLTSEEREELEKEILSDHKRTMKDLLNLAGMAPLTEKQFNNFRTGVFNNFGVSGLETKIKTSLDKYTEKEN